jgi:hypothetical protein
MAQKFLTDIEVTRGLVDSSGDLGVAGQVLSSTGSGTNWITNEANSTVVYLDEFTGDNSTVDFTLSVSVTDENITQVYIDGVYQNKDTYSVSGTTLTFSTAPPLNADIEVITFSTATTSDDLAAGSVIIPVKNTHTASIAKGEPVYITGNVGSSARLEIAPADASNSAKMPAAGLLLQTLAVNAEGYVITGGYLRNITTDTIDGTSTTSNDTVYVKSGGGLTMTKPTGTNLIQNIAKVARVASGNAGSLIVSSILRTNDIPNLTIGKIWVGDSNTVESTVVHLDESNNRLGINNNSPSYSLDVTGTANISGAITTNSTVDGRDVSVDGTKLDGIEANATADQTDAEIRAAVEAATDSNVFTDADHSKLDGIEASADVTDTTNVTAAGALMDSEVTNLADVKAFDTTDYATAAQGVLADSAQQPPSEGAFVNGDKTKLDGIAAGAEVNVQSDWNSTSGDSLILNKPSIPSITGLASETYVDTAVSNLVDSAPATLDTLNELAAALGDDANFSTTVTNSIATKLPLAGGTISGQLESSYTGTGSSLQMYGHAGAASYNYFLNASNDGGVKAVHFVNGSTRTADGGANAYVIRNDGGKFILGAATQVTEILGSSGGSANWNTAYGWGNHASAGYLASSSYTAADVLTKIKTVDGAGSGLDADLLDGSHKTDIQRELVNVTSPAVTAADSCLPSTGYGFKHFLGYGPSNNDGHILGMTWTGTSSYGAQIYVDTDPNNIMAFRSRSSAGVWTGWNTVWHTNNDGSGSGLDADLLDGIDSASFVRSDANDTLSGQYTFTKTNDHAIRVGTIRGTAVGSQSGQFIQMYERVNIGGPSGWGASNTATPSYGLSTYGGTRLAVYTDYTESGGSMRAPIFYDSNNTAYYIDPAGGSILSGDVVINQASVSYTGNDNTPIVGSNTTNRLHINGSIQLTNNDDAIVFGRGTASFMKDEEIGFGWGGGWYMTDGTYLRVRNNKAVYSTGYIYAGLYYDSDNTGYYVNPSATSNLSAVNIEGDTRIGGTTKFNIIPSGWTNANADQWPYLYWHRDTANSWDEGLIKNSSSRGFFGKAGWGIHMDSTRSFHVFSSGWTSNFGVEHGGSCRAAGDLRAPIFYDLGNTGYYLDADSTSNLYNLSLIGAKHTYLQINPGSSHESMVRYMGSAGSSWYVGKRTANQNGISTSDFHWFSQAAGITVAGVTTSGIVQSVGSMRAPIFYDSDNTAYYTDPATATNLNGNTRITNTKFGVSTTGSFNYSTGYGFHTIENGGSNEPVCMFYHQVGTTAVQQYGINIISAANHNNTTSRFMLGQGGSSEKIKIYSNGNIQNQNNSYGQLSDINLKENIVDATSKLDEINQIRVVNFNYIGDIDEETNTPNKQIGVIAQEVEQIFPGLVYECGDTETITKAVKYSVFVPMMLKAIQELKADNDSLKARIETLENN